MGHDFCNETERKLFGELFKRDMDIKPLYKYLCPVIILICFFSIIFNAMLMSISRQSKFINKSPILLLSLNLAVTDLIASLLNGLGILFNSYLPEVHEFRLGQCVMLMFESIRCAALIASALHLLALAFVHYNGIVNPLHYRSTIFFSRHLSRMINIISIFCWLIPLTIMIVWFSSTPCQGFQTKECDYLFLLGSSYRYMMLSVFLVPLVLMSIIYVRIFIIISRHQQGRRLEHERSTLTRGVISVTGPIGSAAAGVNLPELIAQSQCNSPVPEHATKCLFCADRSRDPNGLENADDDDEQTVSMLSGQTDSGSQSSGPPASASCRLATTFDTEPSAVAEGAARGRQHREARQQMSVSDSEPLFDDGQSDRAADKALVLVREPLDALEEATPSDTCQELARAASSLAVGSHASEPLAALERSTIEPAEGERQRQQPASEQRETARAELKPSSGPDANGRRERRSNRLEQQSNVSAGVTDTRGPASAAAARNTPSSSNLENLLLQKCTCDNKLSQLGARSGRGGKLARANTIGFDAQRTTSTTTTKTTLDQTTRDLSAGAHQSKAAMSAISGPRPGSSISSGGGPGGSSLRVQLRRAAPGDSARSRLTATTSVTTNDSAHCATTVTKTNSNSFGGSLQMRQAIDGGAGSPSTVTRAAHRRHHQEPTRRHLHASAVPQTNTKALITTLLILGTYAVSYAPAIILGVLTCTDNCPFPLYEIPYGRRVLYGFITTLLLIAKSIVDPLIYSYRMNEVQLAVSRYLSKRRSKSSSHANSLHTSQRFTFSAANTSQQNLSIRSHQHSHKHRHQQSIQSRQLQESSVANSSFKVLNRSPGVPAGGMLASGQDACPVSNLKLGSQATSPSGPIETSRKPAQTLSEPNALALKFLATDDKSKQRSSTNGSQPSDILGSKQKASQQPAPVCNGKAAEAT